MQSFSRAAAELQLSKATVSKAVSRPSGKSSVGRGTRLRASPPNSVLSRSCQPPAGAERATSKALIPSNARP
jgi:hypothetical protein